MDLGIAGKWALVCGASVNSVLNQSHPSLRDTLSRTKNDFNIILTKKRPGF